MTVEAPIVGMAAVAGLVLGSYAVTAGLRFARAEPSSLGRSHCDSCQQSLSFAQTVPVFSYLRAAGVCVHCRAPIDPIHLAGEVGGSLIVTAAFIDGVSVRAVLLAALGLLLLAVSAIDWKIGRLPDIFTGAVAIAALALAALRSTQALEAGIAAAACTFILFQSFRWVMVKLKGEPALGFGDVKLMCALALWLNLATPWMIALGSVVAGVGAVIAGVRKGPIPLGPALASAGWGIGMAGEWTHWPTIA